VVEMATVSGTALTNNALQLVALGAAGSARASAIRDTTGLAAAADATQPGALANQNSVTPLSALDIRDTGIDGQNGVRLAGNNGALLDLSTTLIAQEASGQGQALAGADATAAQVTDEEAVDEEADGDEVASDDEATDPDGLSEEEEEQVAELRRADGEVRRHEAAHAAAGGALAGAPSFTFERGPDGQLYAVAGEVSIDTAPVDGDPAATIQKLQIVRSAALAPADPSPQDRAVAAQAQAGIQQAQGELRAQRAEELTGDDERNGDVGGTEDAAAPNSSDAVRDQNGPGARQSGLIAQGPDQDGRANDATARISSIINIAV
jgi:hypothetical protein